MNIRNFLASQGYQNLRLVLHTTGPYSARDSEWNYSDVPHLNYIHTKVEACTLLTSKTDISNVFLQKIGPFLLPASVHISHAEVGKHDYVMVILNVVVSVQTTHRDTDQGCDTTTIYQFYYKGFFGWLVSLLAKYATKRNYKTLMSEDMPMRLQRGKLRDEGFMFELDKLSLIGFTDTLDINSDHVNGVRVFEAADDVLIDLPGRSGQVNIDRYKCSVRWSQDSVWVLPIICPHEGADLCFHALKDPHVNSLPVAKCPWHGRRLNPLATLSRALPDSKTFDYLHVTFRATVTTNKNDKSSALQLLLSAKSPKA